MLGACTVTVAAGCNRDERIRAVTAAQRGCAARWQLLEAGVSADAVDRCVRAGRLIRVHRGVYALPGTAELERAAEAAGVLCGGPGARLSYHSAVVGWELRRGIANPVHITVPYGRRSRGRVDGLIVHRSRILTPADTCIHRGLPVTSPAWTLLDVASTLPDRDVAELLDEAVFVRRIVTRREIGAVIARAGGHPGRRRLERVVAPARPRTRQSASGPERRMVALIAGSGLPAPETEVPMLGYRLDLYWPALKLAVEIDTYGTHGSPRRFAADRRKDKRLLAERGITVLRFTDGEIDDRPLETVATLTRAVVATSNRSCA